MMRNHMTVGAFKWIVKTLGRAARLAFLLWGACETWKEGRGAAGPRGARTAGDPGPLSCLPAPGRARTTRLGDILLYMPI